MRLLLVKKKDRENTEKEIDFHKTRNQFQKLSVHGF